METGEVLALPRPVAVAKKGARAGKAKRGKVVVVKKRRR
jgi:hypothetical protein